MFLGQGQSEVAIKMQLNFYMVWNIFFLLFLLCMLIYLLFFIS